MTNKNLLEMMDGHKLGRDPRSLSAEDFAGTTHTKRPLLSVVKSFCKECSGGQAKEATLCTATDCELWPYRKGTNPFRTKSSAQTLGRPFVRNDSKPREIRAENDKVNSAEVITLERTDESEKGLKRTLAPTASGQKKAS